MNDTVTVYLLIIIPYFHCIHVISAYNHIIQFVDANLNIREDFVGYGHCDKGLAIERLTSVILKTLSQLNLNINDCRWQRYYRAGAVTDKINGCSAHILRHNNKSYTHCFSHGLNLVIGKCCSIQYIRNGFDQIRYISYFFKFSERQKVLTIKLTITINKIC